jgi:hypothetical protein
MVGFTWTDPLGFREAVHVVHPERARRQVGGIVIDKPA